jgi:hypothetical protein
MYTQVRYCSMLSLMLATGGFMRQLLFPRPIAFGMRCVN